MQEQLPVVKYQCSNFPDTINPLLTCTQMEYRCTATRPQGFKIFQPP